MGAASAPTNNGSGVGVEDDLSGTPVASKASKNAARGKSAPRQLGRLAGGLAGLFGAGGDGDKNTGPPESNVAATAGTGATEGLPTCADDGTITMTYRQVCLMHTTARIFNRLTHSHQINQDGAGPLEAMVDGTSGGTDMSAFQNAEVTQDVPGLGIQGLSLATTTDFPLQVQMPAGMTCDASVGGADNVCVVRVRNGAGAGPFGGSAAFTQSPAARKRALAYRMRKRMEVAFKA